MTNLDLGVIGNCITGALVDKTGRCVWWCYPRLDGDPVFCSLLEPVDAAGGFMDVLVEKQTDSRQRYVGNTAILETIISDASGGRMRIVDFAPRFKRFGRIFRPTTIVRQIEPLQGRCRICIRIRPRFEYGSAAAATTFGSNHVRYIGGERAVRLTTDAPVSYILDECHFVLDQPLTLILGPDETLSGSVARTARDFFERTEEYWIDWSRYLSVPFEWQEAVIRAAITLKLCMFEETGGIVAALTTSVPEAANTSRNWDYRFCWLRDANFVVQALNRLGATKTMEDFIRYITNVAALDPGGKLKPVYSIIPGAPMPERVAPGLAGYRSYGPVRIGNSAENQTQNDSYGSIVLAATQMFFDKRLPMSGDLSLFERLEQIGRMAAELAFEPDSSLWEFRGRMRVHTYSAVMCWAACDRLARIADVLALPDRALHWRTEAGHIRTRVMQEAWCAELNSFVESLGGKDVDASLLLLREVGFVAADDPRFLGTLDLIERQLRRGNHLLRYVAPDDFGAPTTAFTICTFWYIDALNAAGRREEARAIFEHMLGCRNHLGLLSEDIDPETGELWGNYPQTYSLVGLIVSAMRLSKSWEEAFWRGW